MYDTHTMVHMCTAIEWQEAKSAGVRRPPSLESEGFIHLSQAWQVHLPANTLFSGRRDVLLLLLDQELLDAPLKWEPGVPPVPSGIPRDPEMRFPHLYGPLPVAAVRTVETYVPDSDGRFPRLAGPPVDDPRVG